MATSSGSSDCRKQRRRLIDSSPSEGRERQSRSSLRRNGAAANGRRRLHSASCFPCWCCCSCSCISVKANCQEEPSKPRGSAQTPQHLPTTQLQSISKEEARQWGESFEKLMHSASGRRVFHEFLKSEYSDENILFWLACEELKKESAPEAIEEKARIIYEDFISILSPKEVSLDARVREAVNRNMVEPTAHTFDEAQGQIFTLMHRDSYPRFLNSQCYRLLLS